MIQTNRTLLVEEIAPDRDNIISIIRYMEQRESLSDEEIQEVHQKLEVSSFEEAIEKFKPVIYMDLDTDNLQAAFYRKLPQGMEKAYQAIPLYQDTVFFEELIALIENKRKHKYVLTAFQDLGNSLFQTPSPEMFWKMRECIIREIKAGHEAEAKKLLEQILTQYDEGIFLIKTFLTETYSYIQEAISEHDDMCFVIEDETDTQVHTIMVSDHFEHNRYHTREEEDSYFAFLNKHLEGRELKNQNLMILCMELCCKPRRKNLELLEHYYREYLELYAKVLQKFWWEAKPLLETLLGIRNFFRSYPQEEGGMAPTMVITNCTPELLANSRYRETFRIYLESVNEKNYLENTIWYAIVPRIPFAGNQKDYVRERFRSNGEKHTYEANPLEAVQVVLELFGRYHIQTFLSVLAGSDTVFHTVKTNGIQEFEASFAFLEHAAHQEYMIPSYPNFTIIPQEYTLMILGKKTRYDALGNRIYIEKDRRLWLDDLIIESSYVAAGLCAACQCPVYLSHYYKRAVCPDMPGVAYRLCKGEHNLLTITQMFREVVGYTQELYSQIQRLTRGMVFAPFRDKVIAITDRVYSYKSSTPDCIATIQTLTYMERIIRYESQDYNEQLIREFFQARPGSIISKWKEHPDCVNGILKKDEQIRYDIHEEDYTCTFEIRFAERNLEDTVRINR